MDTTFRDQCMKTVFPRFIEGINAANRKAEHAEAKADALASEVAQLQAKVQELEIQLADAIDRVNALEAKAAEKKTRKPRAKKAQDPVQMVEQAAQDAVQNRAVDMDIDKVIVSTPEQAMNEIPF